VNTRPELPPAPARIAALPVDARGYPVPWFVSWVDGKPEFRAADAAKRVQAVRLRLCWVCGEPLGAYMAFVIGPMCSVNRVSAEPPCHRECAEYSARACPFLSKPQMTRREGGMPEACTDGPGHMIRRNPGVACVWVTRGYRLVSDGRGGALLRIGDPTEVSWWAEGRPATRAEVLASIDSGLPLLRGQIPPDDAEQLAVLERMYVAALALVPGYLSAEGGAS
jgi:hypothetical protein